MTQEELEAFYEKLSSLTENGTEGEVREYVNYHYPRLPENVRQELLFHTLVDAVDKTAREDAAVEQIQEEGLAAIEKLEQLKSEIEKDKLTE